ncbi:DUF393 domain-containing protein [Rhodococcus sp. D2-41]|uniref:DUF393 domain-containing protein n=1 Tax=Speluncibacter jeojiensis TaxID=2710754 RepID=A0A9X4M0Q4_9ACTN|nr:DUF393 domain-containing protein [Rhodococcus sp. D2-41]MDG3011786.1 DUF393 domain-containing protein [Rhodococcus sp. D2-41]MDG3014860.1 DUF393 domain-containing protein [Corynebacteriales bacterium D3-21]
MLPRSGYRVELLYDADCGFCMRALAVLRRIDRHGRVSARALQEPGACEYFGVDEQQALAAAWAREPDGRRHRGAGALNAALSAAVGTRLPLWVYRLPGIRAAQDAGYRWVADNRHRLPGGSAACSAR